MQAELRQNPRKNIPVVIDKIDKKLPVAESGLQKGDIILKLGGQEVPNFLIYRLVQQQLVAQERFFVGNKVDLLVQRGDDELEVSVTLGAPE